MSFLEELRKPFNLFSTAVALLSVLLSIYFYLESVQRREPVFLAYPTTTIVSKAVSSPNFTVVDAAGAKVEGDIQVLEISFWNDGRMPVEPHDIRTPVELQFPPGLRLLDSRVTRENKVGVTRFELRDVSADPTDGPRVALKWAHLDPGTGARLQFIYVGTPNASVQWQGDLLDAQISNAVGYLKRKLSEGSRLAVALTLILLCAVAPEVVKRLNKRRTGAVAVLIGFTWLAVIYGVMGLVFWLLFADKVPPV